MKKPTNHNLKKEFLANFLFNKYPSVVTQSCRLPRAQALRKGSIIDIETTGLDPNFDNIIAIGILERNIAKVHQLTKPHYVSFKRYCQRKTEGSPKPRYAYAAGFEQDFLNVQHGLLADWEDLTQYKERQGYDWNSKDYDTYIRLHLDQCTLTPFHEPDILSREVPNYWQAWLNDRKPKNLWSISYHCLCDLLRERQLVKR